MRAGPAVVIVGRDFLLVNTHPPKVGDCHGVVLVGNVGAVPCRVDQIEDADSLCSDDTVHDGDGTPQAEGHVSDECPVLLFGEWCSPGRAYQVPYDEDHGGAKGLKVH